MNTLATAVRTLFPVTPGDPAPPRTAPARPSPLRPVLAVAIAAAPLVVLIDAIARTA